MILGLPAHTQGRLAHAAAAAGSGRFLLHARDHAPRARHWECSRTLWGVLGPAWERLLLVNPIVADSETGSGTGTCSVAAGTPFLCCGMCVCTIHGRRLGKLFLTSRCSRFGRRFDNIAFVAPAVERMHEPAERRDGREWARFYTVPTPAR